MRIEDKKRLSPLPSSAYFNQNGPFEVKILDTTSKNSIDTMSDKKAELFKLLCAHAAQRTRHFCDFMR